jgi:hypothetical protein
MYECWNPRCSHYAGAGGVLSYGEVFEFQGLKRCEICGREVRLSRDVPQWMWVIPLVVGMVLALVIVFDR